MTDELPKRINIKVDDLKTIIKMSIKLAYKNCGKRISEDDTVNIAIKSLKIKKKEL